MKTFFTVVTLAVLATACQMQASKDQPAKTTAIKAETDKNCPEFKFKAKEHMALTLAENPSTGYRWQLKTPLEHFKVISDHYVADQHEMPMVGVGGKRTFIFEAETTGTDKIHLVYVQPWKADDIAQQWQCDVTVQ